MGAAALAAVLFGVSAVMSVVATDRSRERIVTWVGDKAQSVVDSSDAFDMTSKVMVERLFAVFKRDFDATFEHDPKTGDLKSYGAPIAGQFGSVDQFTSFTGGVATVFGRKDDDFWRITTSLKKENGERAMGTPLGKGHPAYALLMKGEPYVGRATLFGKPYMTRYEPARDKDGKVVGALFIGFDLSPFQSSLDRLVAQASFFETGGTYVIDPKKSPAEAVFVAHPSARGKKVKDLMPGAEDFLARLEKAENGFERHALPLLAGQGDDRWAVLRKSSTTGWWIVSEVSDREAMRTHWATLIPFWALLAAAAIGLGLGLFWTMRRWVGRPLQQLGAAIGTIAGGDLTHPFETRRDDEIGALIRHVEAMRRQLHTTLSGVRGAVESINTASAEIASGNQDLSGRTEQAASSLQQTASSIEQLTGTVRHSADSAAQANQLAASAAEVAQRGGSVVSQVVSTMDEINASSRKISDIIGTIDGIAFQTNILALNAAVEAARAGEQGRGFAVVAGEVRSLAQRSAEAAREIKALIGASVQKVDTGSRLVADAGSTMHEIVASVQRVSDIIGEISAASSEQSQGIGQVNGAVSQLDQMTQQNAALVEQSAAAAESLKDQAARLAQLVGAFRTESRRDGLAVAA
ncbi:MAG: Cache 3/Cache 2 fusion domain-containing protein [Piscinibacter sp.]|nr:Cache 3/Cache 2 fusion domain-containing protein [Piscinibacter sp.]